LKSSEGTPLITALAGAPNSYRKHTHTHTHTLAHVQYFHSAVTVLSTAKWILDDLG
jgi:hypothetical protein